MVEYDSVLVRYKVTFETYSDETPRSEYSVVTSGGESKAVAMAAQSLWAYHQLSVKAVEFGDSERVALDVDRRLLLDQFDLVDRNEVS